MAAGVGLAGYRYVVGIITRVRPFPPEGLRLGLGRSLALSLEFLLGADILRTAVEPSWDEIFRLVPIASIRTALKLFSAARHRGGRTPRARIGRPQRALTPCAEHRTRCICPAFAPNAGCANSTVGCTSMPRKSRPPLRHTTRHCDILVWICGAESKGRSVYSGARANAGPRNVFCEGPRHARIRVWCAVLVNNRARG